METGKYVLSLCQLLDTTRNSLGCFFFPFIQYIKQRNTFKLTVIEVEWSAHREVSTKDKTRSHLAHIHFTHSAEIKPGRCLLMFFFIFSSYTHTSTTATLFCLSRRPHCPDSVRNMDSELYMDSHFSPAGKLKRISTDKTRVSAWTDGRVTELLIKNKIKILSFLGGATQCPFIVLSTALR